MKIRSKSSKFSFIPFKIAYVIRMSFTCHLYVTRMYSYVIRMSLVCTPMSSVFNSFVLVCYPYVTCMSSVCHSYVLVCHPYVTRMYSYVIRMSLVCGFTMNRNRPQGSYNVFFLFFILRQYKSLINKFTNITMNLIHTLIKIDGC